MSIDRASTGVWFNCDSCPEGLDTETHDFSEALAELRHARWTAKQVRGEWVHTCKACQDKVTGFFPLDRDA